MGTDPHPARCDCLANVVAHQGDCASLASGVPENYAPRSEIRKRAVQDPAWTSNRIFELEAERDRLRHAIEGPLGVRAWLASPQPERNRLAGIRHALDALGDTHS